jgi:hypothetical protein
MPAETQVEYPIYVEAIQIPSKRNPAGSLFGFREELAALERGFPRGLGRGMMAQSAARLPISLQLAPQLPSTSPFLSRSRPLPVLPKAPHPKGIFLNTDLEI